MADLEHKVVEIIDKLQDLAQPAMQTAISAIRADGVLHLLGGAAFAFICALAVRTCAVQANAVDEATHDKEAGHIVLVIVTGIFAVGFGIAAAVNLFDPDNWFEMVRPDLYLARALLNKAL